MSVQGRDNQCRDQGRWVVKGNAVGGGIGPQQQHRERQQHREQHRPAAQQTADAERDKYFTAEEAKAYGLVDEVLEEATEETNKGS